MTDAEMLTWLGATATDADLSGDIRLADTVRAVRARLLELTCHIHTPLGDLERKWEEAWNDSLDTAIKTVVQHELDKAFVKAADILRGQ